MTFESLRSSGLSLLSVLTLPPGWSFDLEPGGNGFRTNLIAVKDGRRFNITDFNNLDYSSTWSSPVYIPPDKLPVDYNVTLSEIQRYVSNPTASIMQLGDRLKFFDEGIVTVRKADTVQQFTDKTEDEVRTQIANEVNMEVPVQIVVSEDREFIVPAAPIVIDRAAPDPIGLGREGIKEQTFECCAAPQIETFDDVALQQIGVSDFIPDPGFIPEPQYYPQPPLFDIPAPKVDTPDAKTQAEMSFSISPVMILVAIVVAVFFFWK